MPFPLLSSTDLRQSPLPMSFALTLRVDVDSNLAINLIHYCLKCTASRLLATPLRLNLYSLAQLKSRWLGCLPTEFTRKRHCLSKSLDLVMRSVLKRGLVDTIHVAYTGCTNLQSWSCLR